MLVVVRDGWIPDKYFDIDQRAEAEEYAGYCNANFKGTFSVKWCSENYPQRFERATLLPQGIFNKEGRRNKSHDVS
jgi:hypothetical protein